MLLFADLYEELLVVSIYLTAPTVASPANVSLADPTC